MNRTDRAGALKRSGESSSTIDRFALRGPSAELDPRYHAFRGDLADVALASRLFAPHYAAPVMRQAAAGTIMRIKPSEAAEAIGELEADDAFALLDITGGWGWGYRQSDHLVGYLPAEQLANAG